MVIASRWRLDESIKFSHIVDRVEFDDAVANRVLPLFFGAVMQTGMPNR